MIESNNTSFAGSSTYVHTEGVIHFFLNSIFLPPLAMKKFGLFVLIGIAFGAALVFSGILKTSDWKTYSNTRYEFRIDYPSDWTLGESETNNAGRELYSPDGEVYCYAYGFENALINEQGYPQSLDEFIDWLVTDARVIEREPDMLGDKQAVRLLLDEGNNIKEAKYALGDDIGVGVFCTFESMEKREEYKGITDSIIESMRTDMELGGEMPKELATCDELIDGVYIPLKDLKDIYDSDYTEVTTTSRDAWDRSRLPEEVVQLENVGYACYPMPIEFDNGEPEGDVLPQPEVTMVEWSCELEYEDWKYINGLEFTYPPDSLKEYNCIKQDCWRDDVGESNVWLCTK